MTVYIDRTGEPDDVFEREVLARVGDPATAPQPATPGSDSVRAQIAEAHRDAHGIRPVYAIDYDVADALMPLVVRLRAEAKAEALEEAGWKATVLHPQELIHYLISTAAAYRTNPSKEETHRG